MRKRFVLLAALAGALMLFGTPQGAFAHGGGGGGGGSHGGGSSGYRSGGDGGHSSAGHSSSGHSNAGRSGSSSSSRSGQSASGRSGTSRGSRDTDDRRGGSRVRHDHDRFDNGCCGYYYGYPYGYPYGYGYGYGYPYYDSPGGYNDACSYSGSRGDCYNSRYGPSPQDQGQWDCRSDPYRDQNRNHQACRYYSDCTNYPRCKN